MASDSNPFGAAGKLESKGGTVTIHRLDALGRAGVGHVDSLPYSIKILLESALRNVDGFQVSEEDVKALAGWNVGTAGTAGQVEVPFKPSRVLLQDFTGVPSVVDLAALRSAIARLGGDPERINPQVPCDLVIDHSVQVDEYGSNAALLINAKKEFSRNRERYEFLRWGQQAFDNFRVVPPGTGIVHQVNLEFLAGCVLTREEDGSTVAFPDSLVGTDSHTTMINGLGVLGWGVGGIEAEAVMLGQPIYMLMPAVVGVELTGALPEGTTATDLVLSVTEMLRGHGVVGKIVEFFGDGLDHLSLPDRATLANMAPEYGATMGFFPVDDETLRYLRLTGRSDDQVDLVERYTKEQGLFRDPGHRPAFTETLSMDLGAAEPSLAGPKRPQDRVALSAMKSTFRKALTAPVSERGFALSEGDLDRRSTVKVKRNGSTEQIGHGAVVIAAITSCTNTSNPSVMIAAGLLARKAVEKGLKVKSTVKTSLAPGSRVVTEYFDRAGLTQYLDALGFHTVGYGCTTCIGNSGPLPAPVEKGIKDGDLVAASVLSGNRNFEGRIHALSRANYLASPPLVVAYALVGTVDVDLTTDPLGTGSDGNPVYLRDIWPSQDEIRDVIAGSVTGELFTARYANVFEGSEEWNAIEVAGGALYPWKADSTYIQEPPFFEGLSAEMPPLPKIQGARVLVRVAGSVTTDHISPAGGIALDSPAANFLTENGVSPADFNSYGSRRGNDRVMSRGTFANIRLRNLMAPGTEGGWSTHLPSGERMTIYDASVRYKNEQVPLIVLAGREYGMGSSRDWAAKGPMLLGIRAVIAESYERIHRSNLVGMGILPLEFKAGESAESLGLSGTEVFGIEDLTGKLEPQQDVKVTAVAGEGKTVSFTAASRLDTPVEIEYYRNGGILHTVLRKMITE